MNNKIAVVADDEPSLRDLVQKILETRGYKVYPACNGKEAIEKILAYNPSLFVTDLAMPEKDGAQTVYEIKSLNLNNLVTVVMTGIEHEAVKKISNWAGADYFIQKPFSAVQLLQLIKEIDEKSFL